jgi:hypothetical protein
MIWYLTPLSTQFILKAPLLTAHQYIKTIDQGWFEFLRGQGTFIISTNQSNLFLDKSPKEPTTYLIGSAILFGAILSTLAISLS